MQAYQGCLSLKMEFLDSWTLSDIEEDQGQKGFIAT